MPGLARLNRPSWPRMLRPAVQASTLALAALALHAPAAQAVAVVSSPAAVPQVQATPQKPPGTRMAQAASPARVETRPTWTELSPDQQKSLQPLAGSWPTLSEARKRKWIALSRNFRQMTPEEQAKLHSRMNEWVALTPQQRVRARLNFGETKALAPDDKKAKWEAYQALSPEEKRRLAAGAPGKQPPTTAAAVRPVPPQKLTSVPRSSRDTKAPRIASGPANIEGQQFPVVPPGLPPEAR